MNTADLRRASATAFRAMHRGEMLVLPNTWDALTARVVSSAQPLASAFSYQRIQQLFAVGTKRSQ